MKSKRPIALLAGLSLALFATACGSSSSSSSSSINSGSAAESDFTVLDIGALTGPVGPAATAELQALKAAAAGLNKSGGILGRQISIKAVDDQANPDQAVSLLQNALSSGSQPDLVIAGSTSNETLALLPILTAHKILSMQEPGSAAIDVPSKYPYDFATSQTNASEAAGLAQSVKSLGYKSVGILISNDALGQAKEPSLVNALNAQGIKTHAVTYSDTALDVTPELQQLQSDQPDVLIVSAFGSIAGYILNDRHKLGWTVPILGDNALASNNLAALVPAAQLSGVSVHTTKISEYTSTPSASVQAVLNGLKSQGVTASQPIFVYTQAYDMLQMTDIAAKQAKATSTQAITSALQDMPHLTNPPYATWSYEGYSSTEHGIVAQPQDWIVIKAGPSVDGMIKS
jgi:branched-chain amino acid transport system substrate-binding protein